MVLQKIWKNLKEKGGNISEVQTDQIGRKALVFWRKCGRDRLDYSLGQSGSLLGEHFNFGHPVYLLSDQGENSNHENGAFIYPFAIFHTKCLFLFSKVLRHINTTDLLSSIEKK